MKFFAVSAVLAISCLLLVESMEQKECDSLLHAKKGYVCHCMEDMTTVSCFSVYIRRCSQGRRYNDKELKMACDCDMGFLTCGGPDQSDNQAMY